MNLFPDYSTCQSKLYERPYSNYFPLNNIILLSEGKVQYNLALFFL